MASSPTQSDYTLAMEEILSPGTWMQFPRRYLAIMKPLEAILLAYLCNHAQLARAAKKNNGWFYIHMKRIAKELHIHTRWQSDLIAKLKSLGFISTKIDRGKHNSFPRRFIKINAKRILSALNTLAIQDEDLDDNADES